MKKFLVLSLLVFFFLSLSPVMAEKPSEPKTKGIGARVTQTVAPTGQIEKGNVAQENRRERIRAFAQTMVKRLEAAINRLDKLILRIESRLTKLEAQGQNVAKIEAEVASAKSQLTQAQSDLTLAESQIEALLTGNDPKKAFSEVKKLIKQVKTQVIEVHRLLVHTIDDIKGLRVGNDKNI